MPCIEVGYTKCIFWGSSPVSKEVHLPKRTNNDVQRAAVCLQVQFCSMLKVRNISGGKVQLRLGTDLKDFKSTWLLKQPQPCYLHSWAARNLCGFLSSELGTICQKKAEQRVPGPKSQRKNGDWGLISLKDSDRTPFSSCHSTGLKIHHSSYKSVAALKGKKIRLWVGVNAQCIYIGIYIERDIYMPIYVYF